MATGIKEVHLKEKGISATSTPRRVLLSHGRQTTADSPNGDIPMAKEKPTPNYLKPTISSCHDTSCRYPKSQQQHAEDSIAAAGARKRLFSVKSMEKPALPSSPSKTPKGGTSRTDLSPKAALSPKIVPEKSSKAPTGGKTLTRATSLPKNMAKKVCGNEGQPKRLKFRRGREQEGDGKEAMGGRLKFKQREKGVEVAGEGKAEQENVVLRRQEVKEKDAPPAYNDVIEETATKLATRRSKVKALVGAFESVILLQEPETQPSQRQEVAAVKVGRVGQPPQLKPAKKVKIAEEGAERGQPGREKPEKEVKVDAEERSGRGQRQPEEEKAEKESGEEESRGSQWGQESQQKETKGEEKSGGEESKGGQLGQESRHKETEATEGEGEEGDGVVEEDGSNVTKELTESFEMAGGESAKEDPSDL